MKQGKHYTNLILWIFLAAIIAYIGYNVASSLSEPLTTSTAIEYEAGAGCYTTGFVVRDEEILTSAYDITVITCAEGAHVAANEAVATGYLSDGAQQQTCAFPISFRTFKSSSRSCNTHGAHRQALPIRRRWTRRFKAIFSRSRNLPRAGT